MEYIATVKRGQMTTYTVLASREQIRAAIRRAYELGRLPAPTPGTRDRTAWVLDMLHTAECGSDGLYARAGSPEKMADNFLRHVDKAPGVQAADEPELADGHRPDEGITVRATIEGPGLATCRTVMENAVGRTRTTVARELGRIVADLWGVAKAHDLDVRAAWTGDPNEPHCPACGSMVPGKACPCCGLMPELWR